MLATGGSFIEVIKEVKKRNPKKIIIAAVIAAVHGIKSIQDYDSTLPIYCATIDPELNSKGYIVPGLGDAGDRSFGCKIWYYFHINKLNFTTLTISHLRILTISYSFEVEDPLNVD